MDLSRLTSCLRLGAPAIILGCFLFAALAPAAAAADTVVIGTPQASSTTATSSQNVNKDATWEVKCGSGTYLDEVDPASAAWGTYPTVGYVLIYCHSPNDLSDDERDRITGLVRCTGGSALTGLAVNADRYIKDFKIRCGEIVAQSGQQPRVDDHGYRGSWLLDQVENNDTQTGLACGAQQVATGLRIGYRKNGDQRAFTSVQLFCATVSSASATDTGQTTAAETTKTKTKTAVGARPTPTKTVTTKGPKQGSTPRPVTPVNAGKAAGAGKIPGKHK